MELKDFSISNFNQTLQNHISQQKINYCKAVCLSHRKISVIAKYAPETISDHFYALAPDLTAQECNDFSSFYYGCSPKVDGVFIREAISNLEFTSVSSLEAFLRLHHSKFMVHHGQEKYLLALAKLILITLAFKYGICLKLNEKTQFLLAEKHRFPDIITQRDDTDTLAQYGGPIIELHGCPTQELIDLLEPCRFKQVNGAWDMCENGDTLQQIYASLNNIKLLVGKVFYSGVLVKPLCIKERSSEYESDNIVNIEISYERSTFSTVCAFDENHIHHPLLAHSKEVLAEMIKLDEAYKQTLCTALDASDLSENIILEHVNTYLQASFNVNQIGVSSNVKTSDDLVFLGLRGSKTIDDGCLYPGVNGNAEVYDADVSFYNHSVYEDRPSIFLADARCDFLGEISREAYGELRMLSKREAWECYGIVLSGTAPVPKPDEAGYRRFHFNILFENEADESLSEIKKRKLKASESFENANFIGIRVHCYRNRLHHLLMSIGKGIRRFLNSRDFIESVFLLILAGTSILSSTFSFEETSSLSLVFAVLILITNLIHLIKFICKWIGNLKTVKTIRIYETMDYKDLGGKISKAMGHQFHPVAYAALKMHVDNIVYDHLQEKQGH